MRPAPRLLRPERSGLHLTPAGRIFLPLALAGFLAGWLAGGTTGMFAGVAFALLTLSPGLALLHLLGLRIEPPAPARVSVGDSFLVHPTLANASRLFTVRNALLYCGESQGGRALPGGHLLRLGPGRERRIAVAHRLLRRGRERRLSLIVVSFFPLGLVECRLRFELPVDLLGLPRIGTLRDLGVLPSGRAEASLARRRPVSGEEEFHAVRDWREGDSLRRVHWRLSARRSRLILREYRIPVEAPVHLLFSIRSSVSGQLASSERRRFETMVSLVATLAEHFLRRGRRVRLTIAGGGGSGLPPLRGRSGLVRILVLLAEVEPVGGEPDGDLRGALAASRRRSEVPIVVHAGSGEGLVSSGELLVLGAEDPAVERLFRRTRPGGSGSPLHLVRS